jgi:hypothetical protein
MPQAEKPALVATPTRNRTDGGPASKQAQRYISGMPNYGDGQELMDLQASAPMSKAPGTPAGPTPTGEPQQAQAPQGGPVDTSSLPSLGGPSERPWEHVTTPAPQAPQVDPRIAENAALVNRYLPDLLHATTIPGVPDSYRQFVNYLTRQAQANNQ